MRSADSRYSVKARRSERPDVARSGGYGGDNGKARANQEPAARSRGPSVSPEPRDRKWRAPWSATLKNNIDLLYYLP
jgi:hypothetical protein